MDLSSALAALAERGIHHVLCEGGPRLNTGLAEAQLVDDLCLTLSPKLAGGVGAGPLGGWLSGGQTGGERSISTPPVTKLLELGLVHVLEEESFLFLRLRPGYKSQL